MPAGTGINGIYNYTFGNVGTETQYVTGGWMIQCDKPVWPQYEPTNDDNSNMFGHVQMRQFNYPEPQLTYS